MNTSLCLEHTDSHVVVNIPMQMKRRGERRTIIIPDSLISENKVKPDYHESLVLALARAHRWQELLESAAIPTPHAASPGHLASRHARCLPLSPR